MGQKHSMLKQQEFGLAQRLLIAAKDRGELADKESTYDDIIALLEKEMGREISESNAISVNKDGRGGRLIVTKPRFRNGGVKPSNNDAGPRDYSALAARLVLDEFLRRIAPDFYNSLPEAYKDGAGDRMVIDHLIYWKRGAD